MRFVSLVVAGALLGCAGTVTTTSGGEVDRADARTTASGGIDGGGGGASTGGGGPSNDGGRRMVAKDSGADGLSTAGRGGQSSTGGRSSSGGAGGRVDVMCQTVPTTPEYSCASRTWLKGDCTPWGPDAGAAIGYPEGCAVAIPEADPIANNCGPKHCYCMASQASWVPSVWVCGM